MDLGLKGKVAIVTGGSRGIGRSIALGFAEEGCKVAISARGKEALDQAAKEIKGRGAECLGVQADMAVPSDVEKLVKSTIDAFGRVDMLVNNVGGSKGPTTFSDVTDEDWKGVLDLNLFAAIRASRLVIPQMKKQGGGVIIIISSIYGREGAGIKIGDAIVGAATYNAAKASEISLAKSLAKELAPFNIRVNSVCPGSVIFPGGGWQRRKDADPQNIANFVGREMPLGRFGRPEEIANVVVFLCSEKASLVTGACINVDGCQSRSII
jgi:3-oxoacyl-[acyl-carrier protein] reductase